MGVMQGQQQEGKSVTGAESDDRHETETDLRRKLIDATADRCMPDVVCLSYWSMTCSYSTFLATPRLQWHSCTIRKRRFMRCSCPQIWAAGSGFLQASGATVRARAV